MKGMQLGSYDRFTDWMSRAAADLRGSRVRKDQQDEGTQQSSGPHGRVSYAGGPRSGR